jgi:AcrR family transcriptional regulator
MNGNGQLVRNRPPHPGRRPAEDRRVRRTRRALADALVSLVMEKRYGAITIQNLLDRADIGRSTFYAHYRGKDDLLLRSFERMLDTFDGCVDRDGPGVDRIAPVRELFRHVGEARGFHRALSSAHMLERLYEVGVNQSTSTIARRLAMRRAADVGPSLPAAVVARAAAGALFALLRWWIDHDAPYTADRMDGMFHALVMPGILHTGQAPAFGPPEAAADA